MIITCYDAIVAPSMMGCQQLSIACSIRFVNSAETDQQNAKVGLPESLTLICVSNIIPHWHHRICRVQTCSALQHDQNSKKHDGTALKTAPTQQLQHISRSLVPQQSAA